MKKSFPFILLRSLRYVTAIFLMLMGMSSTFDASSNAAALWLCLTHVAVVLQVRLVVKEVIDEVYRQRGYREGAY